jgi:hypothetical protein
MDVSSIVSRLGDDTLSGGAFPPSSPKRETIRDTLVVRLGKLF